MSDVKFKLVAATDLGLVRSNNEDNFVVNPDLSKDEWFLPKERDSVIDLSDNGALLVVADGMGGMNAGEVASAIAVETVQKFFTPEAVSEAVEKDKIQSFMKEAVVLADSNIKKREKEDESTSGMGTTIVMAWLLGRSIHVCWCGDSRAYLYNDISGLTRLSRDHSYVQQLVDDGKLDEDAAFDHPDSNIITRSLGDASSRAARPDYVSGSISKGDIIMLCTDGLCGLCRDSEMSEIIASGRTDIFACQSALMKAAMDNGGYDNTTMVLMSVEEAGGDTEDEDKVSSDTFKDFKKMASARRKKKFLAAAVIIIILAAAALWLRSKSGTQADESSAGEVVEPLSTVDPDAGENVQPVAGIDAGPAI